MKAVLSPPAESSPWKAIVCDPGGDGEGGGRVAGVAGARRGEGADDAAVDQDLEVLLRRLVVAPLRGVEAQLVAAGGHPGDDLAERAGHLEEGDLGPLGGVGVAAGEAAAVAGDAGIAGVGPGCARRVIQEVAGAARAHRRRLEAGVGQRGRGRLGQLDVIDEGGVVAAGGVQPLEGDRVHPGGDGEAAVV